MSASRYRYNPKRRIVSPCPTKAALDDLAERVRYVGSPYHKRNPGNFGLSPPAQPRPDKTLCDSASIYELQEAERWLVAGIKRGLISVNGRAGYPTNVWAVTDTGIVLEAASSGGTPGTYHGYPLFEPDPFRELVLQRWQQQ